MEPYEDDEEREEAYEESSGLGPPSTVLDGTAGASGKGGGGAGGGGDDVKAVFAHVDLDAFYAQVERSLDKSLEGIPLGGTGGDCREGKDWMNLRAHDDHARRNDALY